MKKVIKILSISLVVIMMVSTLCFAADIIEPDRAGAQGNLGDLGDKAPQVLGVIQWLGIAIAVGMLIFLGIKYISKGVSEQAEIKKSLPIYVLGVALIFGASMVIGAIGTFMENK